MRLGCTAFAVLLGGMAVVAASRQPSSHVMAATADQMSLFTSGVLRLLRLFQLQPGANRADVGGQLGAWAIGIAQWSGPNGHVYATDIEDLQLTSRRARVARDGLNAGTVLVGAAD